MPRWMRWTGYAVGTVVLLAGAAVGYVYAASTHKANKRYDIPATPITIVHDSATIARGRHFATAIGKCVECHGDDLGGKVLVDDPALGIVIPPNITNGGLLPSYSDAELVRVIRQGIKRDGRSAIVMPSDDYQYLTDEDVGAIVAYLRTVPAVTRDPGPTRLRLVGRTLVATNLVPLYAAERTSRTYRAPARLEPDTSLTYGAYLANTGGCTGCHGPGLGGGPIPGMPPEAAPAANLTPTGIGHLSDAQLERILRSGERPDGSTLKPDMPWRYTALMSDLEMRATIKYLRSVPAKAYGTR